jgi:hypothetical protein
MKYSKVIKQNLAFSDQKKDIYLLVIKNPCNKLNFPEEVNKTYFCNSDNSLSDQVYKITHDSKDYLVIGILHNASICSLDEKKFIDNNDITGNLCTQRNNMPIDELNFGMGDIFIKLAN